MKFLPRAPRAARTLSLCAVLGLLSAACAPIDDMDVYDDIDGESDALAPPNVALSNVSYSGTGCPLGTATVALSEDKQALVTTFEELVAEAGPGLSLAAARKNCVLSMSVSVPAGFQYAITSYSHRAFLDLDSRVIATLSSDHWIGSGSTHAFTTTEYGPYHSDYLHTDRDTLAQWSPCGTASVLHLNDQVLVKNTGTNSSARGFYSNESVDGIVTQVYGIAYRACH
jgi:hypothetical protein